jgi:hypothetical protein
VAGKRALRGLSMAKQCWGRFDGFELSSWNFIGHDPKEFRHYGPMAQDFFSAFGQDGIGQIGSETTINSGDLAGILMIAVQALEKRTAELKQKEAQIAVLASKVEELTNSEVCLPRDCGGTAGGPDDSAECAGTGGQSDQVITRSREINRVHSSAIPQSL